MTVHSSVHFEQLDSRCMNFYEILYGGILFKCAKDIQVRLKPNKNNGHFA